MNIWASWVDDLLSCGSQKDVTQGREKIKDYFDLDEVGALTEYVGCKIDYEKDEGWMRLTQPVLIQSFADEFELPDKEYATPAEPHSVLVEGQTINEQAHREYCKGVGKLIHLAKYSRVESLNVVRELL